MPTAGTASYWTSYLQAPLWLWCVRALAAGILGAFMLWLPLLTYLLGAILVVAILYTPFTEPRLVCRGAMTLERGGLPIGQDFAKVSVVGRQLVFEGRRGRFAINRTDVDWLDTEGSPRLMLRDGTEVRLDQKHTAASPGESIAKWLSSSPMNEDAASEDREGLSPVLLIYVAGVAVVFLLQTLILILR